MPLNIKRMNNIKTSVFQTIRGKGLILVSGLQLLICLMSDVICFAVPNSTSILANDYPVPIFSINFHLSMILGVFIMVCVTHFITKVHCFEYGACV
jgi:hypothetical protein